jgi:hypothetical protein
MGTHRSSRMPVLWLGRSLALGWIAAVVVLSAVARARPRWLVSVAASPDRIAKGKLWYLLTSGMLVDRPILISIACFVALAVLAWRMCGSRTFWWAAILGQVAATVLVYALIAAVRSVVPAGFESVMASPDYGVSTISAAWLGSIATVCWRGRGRSARGRFSIAAACAAVGLFAYSLRPDINVLSSEHPVAFALGIAAVPLSSLTLDSARYRRALASVRATLSAGRNRSHRRLVFAVAGTLTVCIVVAPAGLAALRHVIAIRLGPTLTRCAVDWNTLAGAPKQLATEDPAMTISVATIRLTVPSDYGGQARPPRQLHYCRYLFVTRRGATLVLGRWANGRVDAWAATKVAHSDGNGASNANVDRYGRLHLRQLGKRRLVLSS